MAIENRNLPAGTILKAVYKKATYSCEVVATDDGLRYRYGEKDYSSPSAAGSAVMSGVACNGWRFWCLEGDVPTTTAASTSTRAKRLPTNMVKQIRRVANQKGVAEGAVKWFYSCCMASFIAEGTAEPELCPQGHPREAVDDLAAVTTETPAEAAS